MTYFEYLITFSPDSINIDPIDILTPLEYWICWIRHVGIMKKKAQSVGRGQFIIF